MKKPLEKDLLKERIAVLELRQAAEWALVKQEMQGTIEDLNPFSFIKKSFIGVTSSPEIKSNLLDGAVTLSSHLLAQVPILSNFQKPIKKMVGTVLVNLLNKMSTKKQSG